MGSLLYQAQVIIPLEHDTTLNRSDVIVVPSTSPSISRAQSKRAIHVARKLALANA